MMILALLVVGGFAFYVMSSEERFRALRPVGIFLLHARRVADIGLAGLRVFLIALLGRKRWALVSVGMCALLLLSVAIHARYLRSLTDVRPEIERVLAIEAQTTRAYDKAVAQFKLGAISADTLAKTIKRNVMPELQAIRLRLKSLERVPAGHQPLLARADEYLQLRSESWRLRADALEKRNMGALKKAERAERASLEAFKKVTLDQLQ